MSNHNEKELEALVKKYNGFVHFMARKYYMSLRDYSLEDLLQEFRMKLIEAHETHDSSKGKFTTFAGLVMTHHFYYLKRLENAEKRPDYVLSLDREVQGMNTEIPVLELVSGMYDDPLTPHEQAFYDKIEKDIKKSLEAMPRGHMTIDYYLNEMSTEDIAKKNNVSGALVKYVNKMNILKLKAIFKEYIRDDEIKEQFSLDEFNETYDKEFFNGK